MSQSIRVAAMVVPRTSLLAAQCTAAAMCRRWLASARAADAPPGLARHAENANTSVQSGAKPAPWRNAGEEIMAQQAGITFNASRRGFLGGTTLAAAGAALGNLLPPSAIPQAHAQAGGAAAPAQPKGPQYLKFPGKNDKLVVLGEKPLVAETPESLLDDDTTPIEKFYIRNNGQIPDETKNPDAWKITIDGEVNNKLEITLGELKSKYKAVTRRMVLECGGNGRGAFSPPARGNQWSNGGTGCAEWTGVPLADVLKTAGVKPSAKYTAHYAADLHLSGDDSKPTIARGVRMEKALDPYTM